MTRQRFQHDGLTFSYLDAGGAGQPLVALHAHWMEGLTYAPLAATLAPKWRVIALDQRGHGHSDHAPTYTRDDYLGDVAALLSSLGLNDAVLLGNSLGGVNAYQFAARYPQLVRALIIEDIGAEMRDDTSFALAWEGTFATRKTLAERVGPRLLPYLQDSVRQTPSGWRLAFDPRDMVVSQSHLNGDHWDDWLATRCPALMIRGLDSRVMTPFQVEQMAVRRPHTHLQSLAAGHVVHMDNPAGFGEAVEAFLRELRMPRSQSGKRPRRAGGLMNDPDPIIVRIAEGITLRHASQREAARLRFSQLWAEIGPGGDAFHRCALAHSMADVQDDPRDELVWDLRALEAADALTELDTPAPCSVSAFYPSLHLNLGDVYLRLGDLGRAQEHLERGQGASAALGTDRYGWLVTEALARLAERLSAS